MWDENISVPRLNSFDLPDTNRAFIQVNYEEICNSNLYNRASSISINDLADLVINHSGWRTVPTITDTIYTPTINNDDSFILSDGHQTKHTKFGDIVDAIAAQASMLSTECRLQEQINDLKKQIQELQDNQNSGWKL